MTDTKGCVPDLAPPVHGRDHDAKPQCGNQGLVYLYNDYVLLIGGGKMKILMEGVGKAKYIYRGWSDGKRTLPLRELLLWMKDVPRFEGRDG